MFNFKKKKEKEIPQNNQELIERLQKLEEENKAIKEEIKEIKEKEKYFLKAPKMIRFNPFPGEGGDQSFSVSFLNKNGDGSVLTNLYTKEGNRIYGKPIEKGSCRYALSNEEKEAIKKAIYD